MKRKMPSTAAVRPGGADGGVSPARRYLVIALVYVAIVLGHIGAFRKTYEFPYFVTDAVQYVATAQNIAGGQGYMVRGQFNSTNPPLYPAFLSVTIAQSADPMWPAFVWQCIVIGLVVFPAYLLAREVGLPFGVSVVLAAAAGLLPHTFFCAIYMTEVLQYPLWLWACLLVHRWLRAPTLTGGVWLGIVLSLLMWNKVNSALLVIPVVVACAVKAAGEARRAAIVRMILVALGILCVTQGAWLLYKAAQGGNALGLYGSAARESADLPFSLPLFLAYAFDFFLASGFLCVVPAVYFLARRWPMERPVVLFYGILFALQIGWIGVYDGGLAGFVRERLTSFSFPVVAILATRGFVDLQAEGPRRWRYWFAGVPLVFLLGLTWRNVAEFTAFETPWAFALSGWFVPALASQAKTVLVVSALGVFALGAAVCLLAGARRATVAFGVFILVCHGGALASTAVFSGRHAELSMERESEGLRWLHAHGAGYGARVIVVSAAAPWEMRPAVHAAGGLLRGCTQGGSADPLALARLETILRWDVRTVCTAKEIERMGRAGDLLLAEEDLAALPGLRPVAALPGTARRIYQISGQISGAR